MKHAAPPRYEQLSIQQQSPSPSSPPPITRVPDDILALVFEELVSQYDTRWDLRTEETMRLTRICRRWRTTACRLPGLWTRILIWNVFQGFMFLENSGNMPIFVRIERYSERTPSLIISLAMVNAYMHRVHQLHVYWHDSKDILWMHVPYFPAPVLEDLQLSGPGLDVWEEIFAIPLFSDNVPALRRLSLEYTSYPPSSALFRNLRHLTLRGRQSCLTFRGLLDVLHSCPDLETLNLVSLLGMDTDDLGFDNKAYDSSSSSLVSLPRLVALALTDVSPGFPPLFFRYVTLPATTRIDIELDEVHVGVNDHSSPIQLADADFAQRSDLRHAVQHIAETGDTISWFSAADGRTLLAPNARHALRIAVPLSWATWLPEGISPADICDAGHIKTYTVSHSVSSLHGRRIHWKRVLRDMTALAALGLATDNGLVAITLFGALARDVGLCPALESLELRANAFDSAALWGLLRKMAAARREAGRPLKRVVVSSEWGGPDETTACAIREEVGELVCEHRGRHEGSNTWWGAMEL